MEKISEIKLELPEVFLEQTGSFDSKISPIFYSNVFNTEGNKIGKVDYMINLKSNQIIIQHIEVFDKKKGYGKSIYKYIQDKYPDLDLVSSDSMIHKTDIEQDNPDAVILWESMVKNGMAEKTEIGYRMKK